MGDASGGFFSHDASPGRPGRSMLRVVPCKCLNCNAIQVPARVGMGPGWHPGATRACGATPNSEMAVRAVVVGAGLQAIVDSIFF